MYSDLAEWWPLLSSPVDYEEEVEVLLPILALPKRATPRTLLELGAGGGNLASHYKHHFTATLTDLSPEMIDVSKKLNPELEHIVGDMRTLRLDREFDIVLIHDAIMYCTTKDELYSALSTAAVHCKIGGIVVVLPDYVRETFEADATTGGSDAPDGRALRYMEWTLDPDPDDTTFETLYAIIMREANGESRVVLDKHIEGLFSEREWIDALCKVGLTVRFAHDKWNRHVFVGAKEPR
jgi:SAM-dependent methyltransferase